MSLRLLFAGQLCQLYQLRPRTHSSAVKPSSRRGQSAAPLIAFECRCYRLHRVQRFRIPPIFPLAPLAVFQQLRLKFADTLCRFSGRLKRKCVGVVKCKTAASSVSCASPALNADVRAPTLPADSKYLLVVTRAPSVSRASRRQGLLHLINKKNFLFAP